MKDFLEHDYNIKGEYKNGDIWQMISSYETKDGNYCPLLCMDFSMNIINNEEHSEFDFSGTQQLIELFFTGDGDTFPAIWIGCDSLDDLDQQPIYQMDIESLTNNDEKYINNGIIPFGNFHFYIKTLLN